MRKQTLLWYAGALSSVVTHCDGICVMKYHLHTKLKLQSIIRCSVFRLDSLCDYREIIDAIMFTTVSNKTFHNVLKSYLGLPLF